MGGNVFIGEKYNIFLILYTHDMFEVDVHEWLGGAYYTFIIDIE